MKLLTFSISLATILVAVYGSATTDTNGVINCDGLICPKESKSCIVWKKTCGDSSTYKNIRMCSDASGMPTEFKSEELVNPNPGEEINTVSVYGGGNNHLSDKEIESRIDQVVPGATKCCNKMTQDTTNNFTNVAEDTSNYWNKMAKDTSNYWEKIARDSNSYWKKFISDITSGFTNMLRNTTNNLNNWISGFTAKS